jgi:hypothetical protein
MDSAADFLGALIYFVYLIRRATDMEGIILSKVHNSVKIFAAVGGLNNNISININIKYSLCGLY